MQCVCLLKEHICLSALSFVKVQDPGLCGEALTVALSTVTYTKITLRKAAKYNTSLRNVDI